MGIDIKTKLIHWLGGYTKDDLAKHCDSVPVMSCILRSKIKKEMKKAMLLALTTLMMAGCKGMKKEYNRSYENDYETIYIDGCEYIRASSYHYDAAITHKGNCKFCAERRKKELDSLALKIWEGFE